MNLESLEQNSKAWLEYRKSGLGASDIPIIMETSPWKTPYELWESKLGLVEDEQDQFITDKGHRLEPKARALYEIETNINIPPELVQREDRPEHRASLDGYNSVHSRVAEIKFVGAGEKWAMALNGEIPEYYLQQMQWQLYVTGAESNDYVAYNEKENKICIINIKPDIKLIKKMVKAADKFWDKVKNKKEPKLSERDYKRVSSKEMKDALDKYIEIKREMDDLDVKLKEQKEIIVKHPRLNHRRMDHKGTKIITKERAGNIDYKKVMEEHLPDLDLEPYRKPGISYKEIKVGKDNGTKDN